MSGILDTPRLRWQTERHGSVVELSVATPEPQPGLTFEAIDLLAMADDIRVGPGRQRLSGACADLEPAAAVVSFTAFLAEEAGAAPLLFSLAVSLADLPHPEAADLAGAVTVVQLQPGPGIRMLSLTSVDESGTVWPSLTANYLIQTDVGVLALAFATPHVDAAPEFTEVFARLAETVELQLR